MGADDEIGSVEPGKLADLVVLDADPLASIDNIGRVAAVYRGGTAIDLRAAADPLMPIPRPEMVRPLWVERRLLDDGYRFTQAPFEQAVDEGGGGCC
jgi:urease alpha subunit